MCANVDAHLHRTGEVERENVLKVRIALQRLNIRRALFGHPTDTATQGFDFLFDYVPIHACLRSRKILSR